ncbi:MAG: NAD(P)/FAD-dependent oxidoreductase, partial [Flammeovirgaceae bacterium]|nr:NAD(P)/FAD-dependent oxidoreductase [Flammeovirgaceae bacterium]MDW8288267.1 NAD(P)/FAD-dependent oxidoreductase [Flammeovirgaceae bacterium]
MQQVIDVPETNLPRVVIVGGGFAGISLAKKLNKQEVQVVMLDRNNYHTFQPLLYQVATAGLEPDAISFPIRKIFTDQENFFFRMANVESFDVNTQKIHTDIGYLRYDYLVIATGSKTNFFGMESIRENAMTLKTLINALDLRSYMLQNFEKALETDDIDERNALMNFVIVGGGPTGVELAGAMAELRKHVLPKDYKELDVRQMQIHLVHRGEHLLPGMSLASSKASLTFLKKLGVNVWLKTAVTDYVGIEARTSTGKVLLTKNLIWTAGVQGNYPEGFAPQMIVSNRILVDEFSQVIGLEKVYAIGDVAQMSTKEYPKGHPMVAPVAIQQGKHLAKNICNELNGKPKIPFVYHDKGSMATIGKNKAVVDIGKFKTQGALAWFIWMFVHVMSLIGLRNKAVVMVNWVWNYLRYDQGNRLIIRR